MGLDHQAGLGDEGVEQRGLVLKALEPAAHDGGELIDTARGEVADAALEVRPQALGGVSSGGYAGNCTTVNQSCAATKCWIGALRC